MSEEAFTPQSVDSSISAAMEYTDVLSVEQLRSLVEQHTNVDPHIVPLPLAKAGGQELVAPTTAGAKIIVFSLSAEDLHDISDKYTFEVRVPHATSKATSAAVHICINEETAKVMKAFDVHLKNAYRKLMPTRTIEAWAPLVKEAPDGHNTIAMELVLDRSEAPTQILILKPGGTVVEGEGFEFLRSQIGDVKNLKDYTCNPIAEFSWILFRHEDGYHRLRVKLHSILLKKKQLEPPLKRLKMDGRRLQALKDKHCLLQLDSSI